MPVRPPPLVCPERRAIAADLSFWFVSDKTCAAVAA
jgi:hypothetical protein